jgi:hypothetical protein
MKSPLGALVPLVLIVGSLASEEGRVTAAVLGYGSDGVRFPTLAVVGSPSDSTRANRVERFLEAYNTYRIPRALELAADDVVLLGLGALPIRGRAALDSRMRWDSVVSSQFRAASLKERGDTVIANQLLETSAWLQLLDVGYLEYETVSFVFRGSLIAEISFGPLSEGRRQMLERRLEDFLPWARHEYPERLRRIRPGGRFDYHPRRAADWLILLREWRSGRR